MSFSVEKKRRAKRWSNCIVFSRNWQRIAVLKNFENEEAIICDIFITNMLDDDIQCELLRDTVESERARSIAVFMEMGHRNQQRISSNNTNGVNAIQQFNRFRGGNARVNQTNRTIFNRQLPVYVEVVDKIGHQRVVMFALHWVRNLIIVACSIILQRYAGKTLSFLNSSTK